MKTLSPAPKFLLYAVLRALRHPKGPITYRYCPACKLRFHPNEKECPKCHNKVGESPENRQESPIPWWGAILCILIGIGAWIAGAYMKIPGLDEAARALVYIPLGSLFGMSLKRD